MPRCRRALFEISFFLFSIVVYSCTHVCKCVYDRAVARLSETSRCNVYAYISIHMHACTMSFSNEDIACTRVRHCCKAYMKTIYIRTYVVRTYVRIYVLKLHLVTKSKIKFFRLYTRQVRKNEKHTRGTRPKTR